MRGFHKPTFVTILLVVAVMFGVYHFVLNRKDAD